jgi:hypothetical protein
MILVSLPTRPRQPQTFCFAAIGRLENKFLLPRPPVLRTDRRLVTRHVPKSLFYLTRSAPKKCFGALRIEYKDATLAATKLPKNKPQNERP